jgi:HEAT repeat protein
MPPGQGSTVLALSSRFLQDSDTLFVRTSAAEALGNIGPAAIEAVPALVAALKDRHDIFVSTLPGRWGRSGRMPPTLCQP